LDEARLIHGRPVPNALAPIGRDLTIDDPWSINRPRNVHNPGLIDRSWVICLLNRGVVDRFLIGNIAIKRRAVSMPSW
jgi:hypothetical protein